MSATPFASTTPAAPIREEVKRGGLSDRFVLLGHC
jgi:hypothetical protein